MLFEVKKFLARVTARMRFARVSLIELFFLLIIPQVSHQTVLWDFDRSIASSSFGEPVFRLQPPNVIHYSNTRGVTLACLTSGSPKATVTWYSSPSGLDVSQLTSLSDDNTLDDLNSRMVTNITNLRVILQDGAALRLLPFKESQFRQDVHTCEYRCIASNPVATIHSKSASIRAVIQGETTQTSQRTTSDTGETSPGVRVHDEFVQLNSVAVLKCKSRSSLPSGSAEFASSWLDAATPPPSGLDAAASEPPANHLHERLQTEWFTSDGLQMSSAEPLARANKFVAFTSGELHVNNVDMNDLRRTYGCRLRNASSRRLVASSNMARLILMDEQQQQQQPSTQVLHSLDLLTVMDQSDQRQVSDTADDQDEARHRWRTRNSLRHTNWNSSGSSGLVPAGQQAQLTLLPCAVSHSPAQSDASRPVGKWFFQASASLGSKHLVDMAGDGMRQQPVALDQLASLHGNWLQLITLISSSSNQSATTTTAQQQQAISGSRLLVGATFLALERPRASLAGRYIHQLVDERERPTKTICDIKVIIRKPIRLQMRLVDDQELGLRDSSSSSPIASALARPTSGGHWLAEWLTGLVRARTRRGVEEFPGRSADRAAEEVEHIRVSGPGRVPGTRVVRLGDRLELNCLISGHPIESIGWFRQGQALNLQSAADFQTELTHYRPTEPSNETNSSPPLISRLLIRQLQARHLGLQVFECFVSNSLGDKARASLLVYVVERDQMDAASNWCPLSKMSSEFSPIEQAPKKELPYESQNHHHHHQQQQRHLQPPSPSSVLVLEGEPVELQCPASSTGSQQHQIEWFKWNAAGSSSGPVLNEWLLVWRSQQQRRQLTSQLDQLDSERPDGGAEDWPALSRRLVASRFGQLFGGDSRFLMNGSSLQLRSPSKRHDETLFVCVRSHGRNKLLAGAGHGELPPPPNIAPVAGQLQQPHSLHQSSGGQYRAGHCLDTLFAHSTGELTALAPNEAQAERRLVSSISIRIVAKPKIDPFEFSRSLEEGMRTVVICTVVSGQSLVDINWFKDGELLLADDSISSESPTGVSIDFTNGFSSSLTFNQISPSHAGQYTCIASNALAAAEHSSRLLVNVAPYFIEPPKSQRVYLNSNVLINCRAGGQPSPQIRWRKLVPVDSLGGTLIDQKSGRAEPVAPLGGLLDDYGSSQQMAPLMSNINTASSLGLANHQTQQQQQPKHEFRIITSNSHIQILENGSMIIREVELGDAARYSCQASNGVQPILSEAVDLQVLVPAQFEINFETVSVKRDSTLKLNCAPRGDQPMQIRWFKEGLEMVARSRSDQPSDESRPTSQADKYSELLHVLAPADQNNLRNSSSSRRNQLVLLDQRNQTQLNQSKMSDGGGGGARRWLDETKPESGVKRTDRSRSSPALRSELVIEAADRGDSGLFVCLASNPYGKDELTYRLIVQEPPDAPSNLQLQSILSSSLKLSWQTPFDGHAPISYYVIEYRKFAPAGIGTTNQAAAGSSSASAGPDWTRLIVNSNQLLEGSSQQQVAAKLLPSGQPEPAPGEIQTNSMTLKQLTAKSSYQIRVAATNAIGQGLFSPIQVVSTAEEPPKVRPGELRAQPLGSSAVKLSWRGPLAQANDEAPIRGYYVSHRRSETPPASQATGWLATVSVSSSNYSSDQPLAGGAQQVVAYEYVIQALERNTKYEVRVQPFNSMGLGPAADSSVQTLGFDRPRQPVVKLVDARKQSLELKWSVPGFSSTPTVTSSHRHHQMERATLDTTTSSKSNNNDRPELLGFSLYYKCEFDDWQEIQLTLIFHYVIENLRCGNKYQIYLSAYNSIGRSDPSDVMSVRTEGTVPLAPDRNVFIRPNSSEVTLDMSSWSSGGCPITSFMVQFKRLNEKNWFVLSESAALALDQRQTDKIVVPDLKPATWYKLLATVQNEAGTTNAEYTFGTLTPDGQPLIPAMEQQNSLSNQPIRSFSWLLNSLTQLLTAPSQTSNGTVSPGQGLNPATPDTHWLFPLSCLLLLLVTSLATYLYYNTIINSSNNSKQLSSSATEASHSKQPRCSQSQSSRKTNSNRPNEHTMQLFDGQLFRAGSHPCLNGMEGVAGSTASSSGSSGTDGALLNHSNHSNTLTLRHHNARQHAQQQLFQSVLLADSTLAATKNHVAQNSDDQAQNAVNYLQAAGPLEFQPHEIEQPQIDQTAALTNYMLDSFLSQQQQQQQTACMPQGGTCLRHHQTTAAGPNGGGTCRAATMKLFTSGRQTESSAAATTSSGYFDGFGSASLSSNGPTYSTTAQTAGDLADSGANPLACYDLDACEQALSSRHQLEQVPQLEAKHANLLHHHDQLDQNQQQQYYFAPLIGQQVYDGDVSQQEAGHRLLSSTSFASAADLLQRQGEPIYQRLEKFKAGVCGGALSCATLNPQLAYRMKQHLINSSDKQQQHQGYSMADVGLHQSVLLPSSGIAAGAQQQHDNSLADSVLIHNQNQYPALEERQQQRL